LDALLRSWCEEMGLDLIAFNEALDGKRAIPQWMREGIQQQFGIPPHLWLGSGAEDAPARTQARIAAAKQLASARRLGKSAVIEALAREDKSVLELHAMLAAKGMTGVSRSTLQNWANGWRKVNGEKVKSVAPLERREEIERLTDGWIKASYWPE